MKKGMFTIGILALSIINLALNIIIVFTMLPGVKNTNKLVNKISNLVDLDANQMDTDNAGNVALDDLDGVEQEATITIASGNDNGKYGYAKVTCYISLNTKAKDYDSKRKMFDEKSAHTISIIDEVVSAYTMETVLGNKDKIADEICTKLKAIYGEAFVYDVTFSSFIIQ